MNGAKEHIFNLIPVEPLQRLTSSPTNSSTRWQFNDTSNNRTSEARPSDSNLQNGCSSNSERTLARLSNIERKTQER